MVSERKEGSEFPYDEQQKRRKGVRKE